MSKKKTPKKQKTWPQTISSYLSIAREENNIIRGSERLQHLQKWLKGTCCKSV